MKLGQAIDYMMENELQITIEQPAMYLTGEYYEVTGYIIKMYCVTELMDILFKSEWNYSNYDKLKEQNDEQHRNEIIK